MWHMGYESQTRYNHVMPPNAQSRAIGENGTNPGASTAGSRHSGGVNVPALKPPSRSGGPTSTPRELRFRGTLWSSANRLATLCIPASERGKTLPPPTPTMRPS